MTIKDTAPRSPSFFERNPDALATILYAASAGSLVTTFYFAKVLSGLQLTQADVFDIADKSEKLLRITFKNGTVRDYVWNFTEAAK